VCHFAKLYGVVLCALFGVHKDIGEQQQSPVCVCVKIKACQEARSGVWENKRPLRSMALHFNKAPIIEAIINVGVPLAAPPDEALAKIEALGPVVREEYPVKQTLFQTTFTSELKPEPGGTVTNVKAGLMFGSTVEPQRFQARVNGFSFHRLAPYQSWEPFRDEAKRLWAVYRKILGNAPIDACAVRYINRFTVPVGREISDFLRTYPEVAKELPQQMPSYLMRVELLLSDIPGGLLVLQQHMAPSDPPSSEMTVTLDNEFRLPAAAGTDEGIWDLIESVRELKNKVFVNCLTAEMQERIS
jgi:uncharacterized protein (TIGR04255 family)